MRLASSSSSFRFGLVILALTVLSMHVVSQETDAPLDLSGFEAACQRSATLATVTAGSTDGLGRLCSCMASDFSQNLSTADIDVLARDLTGELSVEERLSYAPYQTLSAYAGQAMGACLVIEGFEDGARARTGG